MSGTPTEWVPITSLAVWRKPLEQSFGPKVLWTGRSTWRWGTYVWIVPQRILGSINMFLWTIKQWKWTCAEKLMPRTNGSRSRLKNKASQRANFLFCRILPLFHLIFFQINLKLYDIAPPAMILKIWTILTTACVCPEPAASCNNVRLSKEAVGSTTRSNSSNTFTWAKMLMHFTFASFALVYILYSALKCIYHICMLSFGSSKEV